jgi:TRAP-type C4-dicarboxylate transport system permease small subunit
LARLEAIGIGACLFGIVCLATWQFIERNLSRWHIPFVAVPGWVDGALRHSVFLLGFLGGAYATHKHRHIRIDAVTRVLAPRRRLALRALTTSAATAVAVVLAHGALGLYRVNLQENILVGARELFTPARGALIMVVGYAVIAFHFFVQLTLDLAWLVSGRSPPATWIAEPGHGDHSAVGS